MRNLLLAGLLLTAAHATSNVDDLVGTWSTKSRNVITGPGFYDPVNDKLLEPKLTGYSYSFTSDGYYEEAYYRAIANPVDPACPKGIMQWQHGKYTLNSNGSLSLEPIAVDGRQLLSQPCNADVGLYTRYNQTELFKSFNVYTDPYHNVKRLDLYSFDGSPLHPMYLVYKPPEMLPTETLNPVVTQTAKRKRDVAQETGSPFGTLALTKRSVVATAVNADHWWWFGVFLTSLGGLLMFFF